MQAMAERPKKHTAGRPKVPNPKRSIASIKGSEDFRAWLEGLVEHTRLPIPVIIEHALREYAKAHGYTEPQPRR